MKKVLLWLVVAALGTACSSNSHKTAQGDKVYYSTSASADQRFKQAKYRIIDQEFDNMLAPGSDYDTLSAYELQACGDSYLPPADEWKKLEASGAKKSAKKKSSTRVSKSSKVTNTTNIYYMNGPAPVPPPPGSSSTTTTTRKVNSSYSGSTGSSSYSSSSSSSF